MARPDNLTITEQASAWIAKLDGNEPTPDDLAALKQWMAQHPQHKAEIRRLATLWGELNVLTALAVPGDASAQTTMRPHQQRRSVPKRRLAVGLALAATLLLTIGLLVQMAPGNLPIADSQRYVTRIGEQRLITLPDNSTLLLNTDSQAEVAFTDSERVVTLVRGQAHFDVAKDPARPFLAFAGNGVVRAVGTAFSIFVNDGNVDVTVTEGVVELKVASPADAPRSPQPASGTPNQNPTPTAATFARVSAGQKAIADTVIASVETVDSRQLEKEQSWQDGILRFSGEPLEKVLDEVGRYTATAIVIKDPALRELRFGGVFRIGETDKLFAALESSFGVRVERVNDNVIELHSAAP